MNADLSEEQLQDHVADAVAETYHDHDLEVDRAPEAHQHLLHDVNRFLNATVLNVWAGPRHDAAIGDAAPGSRSGGLAQNSRREHDVRQRRRDRAQVNGDVDLLAHRPDWNPGVPASRLAMCCR